MEHQHAPSVQRSFRLTARTAILLDEVARASGESRNAAADRLLGEAARTDRHPLIRFVGGAGGGRLSLLVGTRLFVHQVMATLRESGGDVDSAGRYLGISKAQVRAVTDYYADFAAEVDADAQAEECWIEAEQSRWERRHHVLG